MSLSFLVFIVVLFLNACASASQKASGNPAELRASMVGGTKAHGWSESPLELCEEQKGDLFIGTRS
jgi:hypothetical protein